MRNSLEMPKAGTAEVFTQKFHRWKKRINKLMGETWIIKLVEAG